MVTSASDGLARVWTDKGEIRSIFNCNNMVMVSKWNKDGSLIASGGQDRRVQVWIPQGQKNDLIVKTFNQENDVVDLDWQNSTDLASCSLDQNIYLWSVQQEQPLRVWRGHQGNLNIIKWDAAGSLLSSCSED